ncbi:uncharacterized protein LOC126778781 isoform X7 [Nymphalis io]|uniref:uncharacterized protein LOC126778781 isoform X7 n=1 Tax=Inachis io TaxID=171585 RepID=UPI00216A3959|nr:uncharacterized protein LOC126778781 isoform X7 [Nymphalis io]
MKPLLKTVVAISLLLIVHAHPENIEDVKELPQSKELAVEAEESEPQARVERCTTCGTGNLKSPQALFADLQAVPGAEVHTQQSFEGCSSEKGCAGLKIKDGKVVERYGNADAYNAAASANSNNEFKFYSGLAKNVFEGTLPGNGPHWWMNQDSPFKGGAASSGKFEKFSKSSSSSYSSTGSSGAGANSALNLAGNPFLNGDLATLAAEQNVGVIKPSNFQSSSYESSSFSASNKGKVDLSNNPFLNGGFKAGQTGFGFGATAGFDAANSQSYNANANAQSFGNSYSGGFASGNKVSTGYASLTPQIATSVSNVNQIQGEKANEFDYQQQTQQSQQNFNTAFQSSGSVSGSGLQQTCATEGYSCVIKSQCNNGVAYLRSNPRKQYCNVDTEICCKVEIFQVTNQEAGSTLNQGSSYAGQNNYASQTGSAFGIQGQSTQTGFASNVGSSSYGAKGTYGAQSGTSFVSANRGTVGSTGFGSTFVPSQSGSAFGVQGQTTQTGFGKNVGSSSYGAQGTYGAQSGTGAGSSLGSTNRVNIPVGCAAALKCTPIEFCTADGVISNTSVVLTKQQNVYRVPLTDCKDIETGRIGKCCRDPYYTDPWPANQLGKWSPGIFEPKSTVRTPTTGTLNKYVYSTTKPTPFATPRSTPVYQTSTSNPNTEYEIERNQRITGEKGSIIVLEKQKNYTPDIRKDIGIYKQVNQTEDTKIKEIGMEEINIFQNSIDKFENTLQNEKVNLGHDNEISESIQRVFLTPYTGDGKCGVLNGQRPYGDRNKLEVDFAEIPWQAMVLLQTNKSLLCGGVITRPDVVVTSAACVDGLDAKNVLIKGGEWKLGIDDEPLPFQIVQVKTILLHPLYVRGSAAYDSAILVLAENLRFAKNINPICLPRAEETIEEYYNGIGYCIVTGWGKDVLQAHLSGSIMHSVNVSLLRPGECQAKLSSNYPNLIDKYDKDSCVCGQPSNPLNDICKVDVGSALACTGGDGQYVFRGVYSWDSGCETGNQIAAFYRFDLEWYQWAIGIIESAKFTQYTIITNVIITDGVKYVYGFNTISLRRRGIEINIKYIEPIVKNYTITQTVIKKEPEILKIITNKGSIPKIIESYHTNPSFISYKTKPEIGIYTTKPEVYSYTTKPEVNSYTTKPEIITYTTKPKVFSYTTKPEIVTYTTKPKVFSYTTKPEIITYTTKPKVFSYTTKPEIFTYTTKPKVFSYTTKPEIISYTTKPEIFTYTTKPKVYSYTTKPEIFTYTTKPQLINYETSGSRTDPQYIAPAVSSNPSFEELVGKHEHTPNCKCLEGKK